MQLTALVCYPPIPGTCGWVLAQGIRCLMPMYHEACLPTQHFTWNKCPPCMEAPLALKVCLLGMAGYNAGPGFHPSNAFAIHHPGGNAKRISFVNDTCACIDVLIRTACLPEPDALMCCQSMLLRKAILQACT